MKGLRRALAALAACAATFASAQTIVSYSIDGPDTINIRSDVGATYTITAHYSDGSAQPVTISSGYLQTSNASVLAAAPGSPSAGGGSYVATGVGTSTLTFSSYYSVPPATKQVNVVDGPDVSSPVALDCASETVGPWQQYYPHNVYVGHAADMIPVCNNQVLVASTAFNRIQAIDLASGRILRSWLLTAAPINMVRVPGTSWLFATLADGSLARVDLSSGAVVYVPTSEHVLAVTTFEAGQVVAVSTGSAPHAFIVDASGLGVRSAALNVALPQGTRGFVRYAASRHALYVAINGDSWVDRWVYDTVAGTFGSHLQGANASNIKDLALSPDGSHFAVGSGGGNDVAGGYAIADFSGDDMATVLGYFDPGAYPATIDFRYDGAKTLVSNTFATMVYDVATHKIEAAWNMGRGDCADNDPTPARWSPHGQYAMYLANGCRASYATFETLSLIGSVQVLDPATPVPPPLTSNSAYVIEGPDTIDVTQSLNATYGVHYTVGGITNAGGAPVSASNRILANVGTQFVPLGLGYVVLTSSTTPSVSRIVRITSAAGATQPLDLDCSTDASDPAVPSRYASVLTWEVADIVPLCHGQALLASFDLMRVQAVSVQSGTILHDWPLTGSPLAMVRVPGTNKVIVSLDTKQLARIDLATGQVDYAPLALPRSAGTLLAFEPGQLLAIATYPLPNYQHGIEAYVIDASALTWTQATWPAALNPVQSYVVHYDATQHRLYYYAQDSTGITQVAYDATTHTFTAGASTGYIPANDGDFGLSPDGGRIAMSGAVGAAYPGPTLGEMSTAPLGARLGAYAGGLHPQYRGDGQQLASASFNSMLVYDTGTRNAVAGLLMDHGGCGYTGPNRLRWSQSNRYVFDTLPCDTLAGTMRVELTDWPAGQDLRVSPALVTLYGGFTPSLDRQTLSFTATVTSSLSVSVTGSVTFTDNGAVIGGCANVPLDLSSFTAVCSASLGSGMHSIVANYSGDTLYLPASSGPYTQKVLTPDEETNFASDAQGATVTTSSDLGPGFWGWGAIDGDRAGRNWTNGGGWADGTLDTFPDWIQVNFQLYSRTIDRVVVYSVQDNWQNPVEPTDTMTFTQYGVTDFVVEGWTGSAWQTLATVTGNNLVKRTVTFTPFTTNQVRVVVTGALNSLSRITELEVFGNGAYMYPAPVLTNVAAASSGATATASSTFGPGFGTAGVNDGNGSGYPWGNGGGWADGTIDSYPDWLEVDFNGTKLVDHVVVYTLPDNYQTGAVPYYTTTFTKYGIVDFTVQGWDGEKWVTLGTVTNNNLAKRTVMFDTPFATPKIRVNVTRALASLSRITEVEAWGTDAPPQESNFALAALGATATASSQLSTGFPVAAIIDGERAGRNWSAGGGWADASSGQYPDWVQVDFAGMKSIDHVVLFTVQDNWQSPVEPTDTTTFSQYGVTDFNVQAWDGTQWQTVATVSGNNLVRRTVSFASVVTSKIRVNVTGSLAGFSRITELQAWGVEAKNYALPANGMFGMFVSSTYGNGYPASALTDGDRKGTNWSAGGGWADATPNQYPDTVQFYLSGYPSLREIVVYTLQDNWQSPVEPTDDMTFTQYGITDFTVEAYNGSQWVMVANVTNNNKVKRAFPVNSNVSQVRVTVYGAKAGLSRITEIEAWGN